MNKFTYLMLLPVVLGQDLSVSRNRGRASIRFSKSYEFHTTPKTFEDARKICKQHGGDLAIITSQDEEHVFCGFPGHCAKGRDTDKCQYKIVSRSQPRKSTRRLKCGKEKGELIEGGTKVFHFQVK
uniref:Lectin-like protein n=1 Tax=Glyptapanteles flavicoxis TaxID=463051 RepID=B7S839_9HYME|nr:lectin-like protein [Glyptapanteles flavicoxis]